MNRGEAGWPPHNPEAWECTAGHDCAEGYFWFPPADYVYYPDTGGTWTMQRCSCVVANIRENKRRGKFRPSTDEGVW